MTGGSTTGCPGGAACTCGCCDGVADRTPRLVENRAGLDAVAYRNGTWADFRASLHAGLTAAGRPALARLTTRDDDDPTIGLLDAWAVAADVLTFYTERLAQESYLRTARDRASLQELGRLIGYRLRPGVAAETALAFAVEAPPAVPELPAGVAPQPGAAPPVVPDVVAIPRGLRVQSVPGPGEVPQTFETVEALDARAAWGAIPAATTVTGIGATEAWLAGTGLNLKVGDAVTWSSGTTVAHRLLTAVVEDPRTVRTRVRWSGAVSFAGTPDCTVYRKRLAPFGHSAPDWRAMSPDFRAAYEQAVDPPVLAATGLTAGIAGGVAELGLDEVSIGGIGGIGIGIGAVLGVGDWPHFAVSIGAQVTGLRLDGEHPDVRAGSTVLLAVRGGPPARWDVTSATVGATAEFAVSGKVTVVDLADGPAAATSATPRQLVVHAAPEALTVARRDDPAPVGGAVVEIDDGAGVDREVTGLEPGRRVIVTGRSTAGADVVHTTTLDRVERGVHPPDPATVTVVPPLIGTLAGVLAGTFTASFVGSAVRSRISASAASATTPTLLTDTDTDTGTGSGDALTSSPLGAVGAALASGALTGTAIGGPGWKQHLVRSALADPAGGALLGLGTGGSGAPGGTAPPQGPPPPVPDGRWDLVLHDALPAPLVRSTVVVHANVALATHGETHGELLGGGRANQTHQRFTLHGGPLTYVQSTEPSGATASLEVRVDDLRWTEVATLYGQPPTARAFAVGVDQGGRTYVQFGDGVAGRRLPTGAHNVRARYRVGLGTAGNVGAAALANLLDRPLGLKGVSNPAPATGGGDPEPPSAARAAMPLTVRTLGRAVSVLDYEDYARAFAGVSKATATVLPLRAGRTVVVTVAFGDDGTDAPGERLVDLKRSLVEHGDPGVEVVVLDHVQVAFHLGLRVVVDPDREPAAVLAALETALRGAWSFPQRAFGAPVERSAVVAVAHAVPGVVAVDLDRLYTGVVPVLAPRLVAPAAGVDAAGRPIPAGVLVLAAGPFDALEVVR